MTAPRLGFGIRFPSGWAVRLQRAWLRREGLARLLWPLSCAFRVMSAARRYLYRIGIFRSETLPVPVIVVGNLVVGGAGKTPVVLAVVALLRRHGHTPGIVSRGYRGNVVGTHDITSKSTAAECGDEPLLLHQRTQAPVAVGRRRAAAAHDLLARHPEVDILVADDGVQHLALNRDVQVLVFDERGAGNGWVLPAGPLREPLPKRPPARTLVIYNAAAPSTPLPGYVAQRRLAGAVSLADWWQGRPASIPVLESLRGRRLVAAAGLARPKRFFEMLQAAGLQIEPLELPDHHDYASLPWPPATPDVIVTEKDAVKIDVARLGATRVWVAPLDLRLDAGFESALIDLLPPPGTTAHGNATA